MRTLLLSAIFLSLAAWVEAEDKCAFKGGLCLVNTIPCDGLVLAEGNCHEGICCKQLAAPDPEFRAFFIATVDNIDWPMTSGETSENQQDQLIELMDVAQEMNFNAVLFQIRPAFDAFYPSLFEPWSKWLTGNQGVSPDPMYDPLQFAIAAAHAGGMQLHVWMNPYRGGLQTNYDGLDESHICNTMRQYCYVYDNYLWLDPGAKVVEDHLMAVVNDVASRYEIDGLHFDDYFYPYPSANGDPFPDNVTYSAYQTQGGSLGLSDWRRDNVNRMVQRVYQTLHQGSPNCILSISPPGTYRPGHPEGMPSPPITGFDPYEGMFADTKLWLQEGWVDFFAPQLYWQIDPPAQSYPVLLDWWLDQNILDRNIYTSNGAYRVFTDGWPVSEITNQVEISRNESRRAKGSLGNIHFSAKYFRDNYEGITDAFKELYSTPAAIPPYPWLLKEERNALGKLKKVEVNGKRRIEVDLPMEEGLRGWVVHKVAEAGDRLVMVATVPKGQIAVEVEAPGRYSVRALSMVHEMGPPTFIDVA